MGNLFFPPVWFLYIHISIKSISCTETCLCLSMPMYPYLFVDVCLIHSIKNMN